MDRLMGGIQVGAEVDTQRSNGRIHSAVISGMNAELQIVTVEWFEGGETKGKEVDFESILRLNEELAPAAPAPPTSSLSGRPQRKSTMASTALAASRRSGVLPPSIPKVVPIGPKTEGNSERTTSRRNTSRQSHVITPGSTEVNGRLQNGKRDGSHDHSRERRDLVKRSGTLVSSNGPTRNSMPKSPQSIPKAIERRKSPSNTSSESKSTTEGSLMPPPRLTRRRSPSRIQSPEQISSNTIDLPSNK